MSRYELLYFNRGRADRRADLTPLPPEQARRKARAAYLKGFEVGR